MNLSEVNAKMFVSILRGGGWGDVICFHEILKEI